MKTVLVSIASLIALAGCSTTPQEQFAKQQEAVEKKQVETIKRTVSNIPDWFIDYNPYDGENFFAVATSTSNDPQVALDDAKTLAVAEIVRITSSKVSAQKSILQRKGSSGAATTTSELIIDELAAGKSVAGYKVVKRNIQPERNQFRAYVLVSLKESALMLDKDEQAQLKESHSQLLQRIEQQSQ